MEIRPQMEVFQPLKTLVTSLSFCSVVVTAFFLGGLNQANVRFCMLSQASSLQSPRQTPITLGKRKRREGENPAEDENVVEEQVAHLVMEDYEMDDDNGGL
ncbi:hypothetical protein HPB51_004439 [Rhipicephalus microplus]|uniref:Transmembrane protein n=1 Tax=Rhipicephalus microplus TaxID=6941 RepID=A0A9J6ELJ2_RHIMP|nr:hypothetical protein HPB51_004439 [Rhipicephalus microplus]